MKIPFRQGIVRYQQDNAGLPTFLRKNDLGSTISLMTVNQPTVLTFAHKKVNYLHEEAITIARAWSGFETGNDYWLYVDIDGVTALRTFGTTTVEPVVSLTVPVNPAQNLHWFDARNMVMQVWNGIAWIERIRVFVGKYANGGVLTSYPLGSQINVKVPSEAGFIIFGSDGAPIRRQHDRKSFEFATTSSIFNTITAKAVNVSLDAICTSVTASEPIPAFRLITRDEQSILTPGIKMADAFIKGRYAVGIVQEDLDRGETGIIAQHGYITNEQWNYTELPGTPLFLAAGGQIVSAPAQKGFVQRVGEVVSSKVIRVDIQPPARYVDSTVVDYKNAISVIMDKVTGELLLSPDFAGGEKLTDASKLFVTALGGPKKRLEEWMADFLAEDEEIKRRLAALENGDDGADADVDYIRPTPMTITVGGAVIGTTFDGTVQDALDKILYPFGAPSFRSFELQGTSSVLEAGATIVGGQRTFNWTTNFPDNIRANTVNIVDSMTGANLARDIANSGSKVVEVPTITRTSAALYTWTISATNVQSGPLSRPYSVEWRWKIYYGSNTLETVTSSDVLALLNSSLPASPAGTYVMPAGGYKWLCYPSSFPTIQSFKDLATGLNVAVSDPIEVSVTSRFGLVQKYKCHRTFNKLGSALTMVVS